MSPAQNIATRWKPARFSTPAVRTPRSATPMSPAMRATALFTADAMPDRSGSIDPRIAEVSGATVMTRPKPVRIAAGSTCVQ
jgi:hypothetical protein